MPFLSDMLDQSRRQQDEEQALARENLAEASLLQAHLSHRSALHSRFRFDPAAVMDCLRAEVLGQEPALQAVEDMLKVVRADIADPRRPLFSALFGEGTILNFEGAGAQARVQVNFESEGSKWLMLGYAKLEAL